jgi:hypothetical protein
MNLTAALLEEEQDCVWFCSLFPRCVAVERDTFGYCTIFDKVDHEDDVNVNTTIWIRILDTSLPPGTNPAWTGIIVPVASPKGRDALRELRNKITTLQRTANLLIGKLGLAGNSIADATDGLNSTGVINVLDKALGALITVLNDVKNRCDKLLQAVKALQVSVKTHFMDRLKAFADIVGQVVGVFEEEPFKLLAGLIDI